MMPFRRATPPVARHSPLQLHSPARVFLQRASVAVVVLLLAYLVFEFGRIQGGYDILDVKKERLASEDAVAGLQQEIVTLKEQIALLETDQEVDAESYKEVGASLVKLQAKIQEQKDAIAFYRGIVSPEDGEAGLRVQDLKLTRSARERAFNVRLVLVQSLKHDRKVSGDVSLSVEGEQGGETATYPYRELMPEESKGDWAFSFRYFQDFDREIVLPDGFTPERIIIEVHSKTRSIDSIEETYPWTTSLG